jgi:hypothetical protein
LCLVKGKQKSLQIMTPACVAHEKGKEAGLDGKNLKLQRVILRNSETGYREQISSPE